MVQRFDLVNVGCAERIWRQAEELAARDYEVTLVQFPHPERRREMKALRVENPQGVQILNLDRNATRIRENTRILAREIERTDWVHLWKCYPDTAIPVLWGLRKYPRPLHYDWDDLEGGPEGIAHRLTGSLSVARLVATWEHEILNWVDSVTVASQEIGKICKSYGYPESSIFFGPVGAKAKEIDSSSLGKWKEELQGKRALSFLGQMEAEDFPVEVLGGVSETLREQSDLLLVMVGDGAGRHALEEEARRLRVEHQCLFTGYLPHTEAQAILSLSTGFLFPLNDDKMSRCKSPLVVVEALSHGVPVLGSNVGEVPAMVGDCGILVSGLGKQEWRDGLSHLLDMAESDSSLRSDTCRHFEENWTWSASVDNLEKAYHHAFANIETSTTDTIGR